MTMKNHADAFMAKLQRSRAADPPARQPSDIEAESFEDISSDRGERMLQALAERLAPELERVHERHQVPAMWTPAINRIEAVARDLFDIPFADMMDIAKAIVGKLPPNPTAFDMANALNEWAKEADVRKLT
jgi:hypothetical protein